MSGNAQLAAVRRELADAAAAIDGFRQVPAALFGRRPAPAGWSAAECVAHLNLTTDAYLPMIDRALSTPDTRTVGADHRYRGDLMGRMLTWLLEPPFRTRTKTAPGFEPAAVLDQRVVIDEFHRGQEALAARVARGEGRDLERIRLASPFNARVKYNLYSALTILLAHERRHIWQANRAIAAGHAAGGGR